MQNFLIYMCSFYPEGKWGVLHPIYASNWTSAQGSFADAAAFNVYMGPQLILTWRLVCSELHRISFIYHVAPFCMTSLVVRRDWDIDEKAVSKSETKGSALVSLKVWLSCTILDSTKIETSFLKLCYKKLDMLLSPNKPCLRWNLSWWNFIMLMSQIYACWWHPHWWVGSFMGRRAISALYSFFYALWSTLIKCCKEYLSFHFWHFHHMLVSVPRKQVQSLRKRN